MKRIFIVCAIFISFLSSAFCQQIKTEAVTTPVQVIENEDDTCIIVIDSNITGAEVYINGEYKGRTRLEMGDLVPGFYSVRVVKSGYEQIDTSIYVRKGYTNVYNLELNKTAGYINFTNITGDCEIYVDGNRTYVNPLQINTGNHSVLIKRFGYKSFEKQVEVKAGKTAYVTAELGKTEFEVENLYVTKKVINPAYKNSFGNCIFGFDALCDSDAVFEIYDEHGKLVWKEEFSGFNQREQKIKWDGRDNEGKILADGKYTASIKWNGGKTEFEKITIDSSLAYSLFESGYEGSCFGSTSLALKTVAEYIMPSVDVVTVFASGGNKDNFSMPLKIGVTSGKEGFGEASLGFTVFPVAKNLDTPFVLNVSYKYGWYNLLNNKNHCLNAFVMARYGYSSVNFDDYYFGLETDVKADFGSGLGFGGGVTYVNNKITAAYSLSCILAPESGKFNQMDDLLVKNSVAFAYEFTNQTKAFTSFGVNNLSSVQIEGGFLCMPFATPVIIEAKAGAILADEGDALICIKISLSYLL